MQKFCASAKPGISGRTIETMGNADVFMGIRSTNLRITHGPNSCTPKSALGGSSISENNPRTFRIRMYARSVRENLQKPVTIKYGPLPRYGLPVQVQCDGFKCMAYLDKEGRWRDLFSHELLPCVRGVILP